MYNTSKPIQIRSSNNDKKKIYSNIRDVSNQPDTLLPLECNQVNMVVGDEQ